MKNTPKSSAGTVLVRRRKPRPRKTPQWLKEAKQYDAIARSRCLLMLAVLSGEIPVRQAAAQAKISQATYYKLETQALQGMLRALNPATRGAGTERSAVARLEAENRRLQQEKRRLQRLWLLSCKSLRVSVRSPRRGRWPQEMPSSAMTTSASPGASSP